MPAGIYQPVETISKMIQNQTKNDSHLHTWVHRRLGKAHHCEECGLDKIPIGKKRYFDWANISGKYK